MTTPTASGPIETKVTAATALALLASIIVAILNAVVADNSLLGGMPPVLQALLLAAVPPLITFLGGYAAPHTPRQADHQGPFGQH
jgi:hypothetical protein